MRRVAGDGATRGGAISSSPATPLLLVALCALGACAEPPLVRHGCANCHQAADDSIGPSWESVVDVYCDGPASGADLAEAARALEAFLDGAQPGRWETDPAAMPAIVAQTAALEERERLELAMAVLKAGGCPRGTSPHGRSE